MNAVVFVGPTLDPTHARHLLDATYLPPVAQGDVMRLLDRPPAAIGIIDGYFELVPSVWHKEILVAMARGVRVFGAASMGALRAAELHDFGMEGVGEIFEWYRSGVLEDDDEVAVAHGPADSGFRSFSVAMVDVRDLCRRAVEGGVVQADTGDLVMATAKALYYADRSWPAIFEASAGAGVEDDQLAELRAFSSTAGPGLKARDAAALLHRMGEFLARPWSPTVAPVEVERTVFLDKLETEVATMTSQVDGASLPTDEAMLRVGETVAAARKKVLLRMLARREASRLGLRVTEQDMQAAADDFRREFGLLRLAQFQEWFAAEGVTQAAWIDFLQDRCLVAHFERHYSTEINAGLRDYLAMASVRAWPGSASP